MRLDEQIQRLSVAIEALDQAQTANHRMLLGTPEERGDAAAAATISVIRAKSQIQSVVEAMMVDEVVSDEEAAQ